MFGDFGDDGYCLSADTDINTFVYWLPFSEVLASFPSLQGIACLQGNLVRCGGYTYVPAFCEAMQKPCSYSSVCFLFPAPACI